MSGSPSALMAIFLSWDLTVQTIALYSVGLGLFLLDLLLEALCV